MKLKKSTKKSSRKAKKVAIDPSQVGVTGLRSDIDRELDVLVSLRKAETITGQTRDYIRKRLRESDCGPAAWRGPNRLWTLQDIWQAVGPDSHAAGADPDNMLPSDRRAHYHAESLRLKLEQQAAGLIPAAEVAEAEKRIRVLLRQMCSQVLDGVRAAGGSPQMVERAQRHIESTLGSVLAV